MTGNPPFHSHSRSHSNLGALVGTLLAASFSPSPMTPSAFAEAPPTTVTRRASPAGGLILVEPRPALPIVQVVVAVRAGSAWDPRHKDGLANLVGELSRRGAAGLSRAELDRRLDALGATLEVRTDPDALRFEGQVLSRHLDAYLAILADILLRPDFDAAELESTRRDILAAIDESRNDDRALCARYFVRALYADHPYGHAPDGDRQSLPRITAADVAAFHKRHFIGPNLVFAAEGDVTPAEFSAGVERSFGALPGGKAPGPNPLAIRPPVPPRGWRISLIDKPERQQVQIMFGHIGVPASDPDFVPLMVATSAFGGHGMTSTLMDEVRTRRGLAYGAYMSLSQRLGAGASIASVFSARAKAITTLKLSLRLYVALMDRGIPAGQLALAKTFLAGSLASEMDEPDDRLDARVTAEITGLPPDFVDTLPARVKATTAPEVEGAINRHVHARDLAITVVATAADFRKRLVDSKVAPSAVDVIPYEEY
jgi:zinc protease